MSHGELSREGVCYLVSHLVLNRRVLVVWVTCFVPKSMSHRMLSRALSLGEWFLVLCRLR